MKIFYKKNFIILIGLILILLSIIMAINYYIDPANQFYRASIFAKKIAHSLLNKKEVAINTNYNERALQKLMLENIPNHLDILFLGSSHSLPINHMLINNSNFYNASVSAGTLEDDMALYYIYQKRNLQPKTVIICLDPWIVAQDLAALLIPKGKDQWKITFASDYYAIKNLVQDDLSISNLHEKINGFFTQYFQLLSFDYFKESIKKFKLTLNQSNLISFPSLPFPHALTVIGCFLMVHVCPLKMKN